MKSEEINVGERFELPLFRNNRIEMVPHIVFTVIEISEDKTKIKLVVKPEKVE